MHIFLQWEFGQSQRNKNQRARLMPICTVKLTIFRAQQTVLRFVSCVSKSKTLSAERQENRRLFQQIGISLLIIIIITLIPLQVFATLDNDINQNKKQFGNELSSRQYSDDKKSFIGKKIYQLPLFGWQVEAIYKDGKSFSETARPKGNRVKKNMITEQEANVISDMLYPKKNRGPYRKQIKNAHFLSHFFEYGVVSYEMQLDNKRKKHLGVIGVRTILYSNGDTFKKIKVNAYQ